MIFVLITFFANQHWYLDSGGWFFDNFFVSRVQKMLKSNATHEWNPRFRVLARGLAGGQNEQLEIADSSGDLLKNSLKI